MWAASIWILNSFLRQTCSCNNYKTSIISQPLLHFLNFGCKSSPTLLKGSEDWRTLSCHCVNGKSAPWTELKVSILITHKDLIASTESYYYGLCQELDLTIQGAVGEGLPLMETSIRKPPSSSSSAEDHKEILRLLRRFRSKLNTQLEIDKN